MLTSSRPIMYLDAKKDPVHPKLLAVGDDEAITGGIHSNQWPCKGKDKIVLFSSESNATVPLQRSERRVHDVVREELA